MRRIVCREFGRPEHLRLEVLPDPRPGPGEVLVKVYAARSCPGYRDIAKSL